MKNIAEEIPAVCEICQGNHATEAHEASVEQVAVVEGEVREEKPLEALFEEMMGTYPYDRSKLDLPGYEYISGDGGGGVNVIGVKDTHRIEQLNEAISTIKEGIKAQFPETELLMERLRHNEALDGDMIPFFKDRAIRNGVVFSDEEWEETKFIREPYCDFKSSQTQTLYVFASLLKGEPVLPEDAYQEIKTILQGKKILILGADFGVFAEVLQSFGAEAVGVEYNPFMVKLAHSGILAEDLKPQTEILRGNVWDIADDNTSLFKALQEKGPFDIINSYAFFNWGSGFLEGMNYGDIGKFRAGLESLLQPSGFQVHARHEGESDYSSIRRGAIKAKGPKKIKDDEARRKFVEDEKRIQEDCYEGSDWGIKEIPHIFKRLAVTRGHVIDEISKAWAEATDVQE